ncbi:MAG: LysR family transcriptional regulator [Myxococcota bacterium]
MDLKIEDLRLFVTLVDAGSFSEAARRLGIPRPSASRRLAALERDVGVRLLWRTTRRMGPTDIGAAFYDRCQHVLESLGNAERIITDATATPSGHLRIARPPIVGSMVLGDTVTRYMAAYPDVTVSLHTHHRRVDLRAEAFDVAIYFDGVTDDSLVVRKVGALRHQMCAAPSYLEAFGTPRGPKDLAKHRMLLFAPEKELAPLRLIRGRRQVDLKLRPVLLSNTHQPLREAAVAGQGIALLPAPMVDEGYATKRLVPVLPQWWVPAADISIAYVGGALMPLKLRAFLDLLGEHVEGVALPCERPMPRAR